MKKIFLFFSLFSFLFSLGEACAYTSTDVSNADFLADQGIIVKQSSTASYRLDATITRAEVMGIALKIKGIVLPNYQCKGYYTDTRDNNWICRAVELAADNGIITRGNAKARPQDNITRAEALAIIMKASGNEVGMGGYAGYKYYFDANLYTEGGVGFRDAYNFGATWQAETFYQYIRTILEDDSLLKQNPRASTPATRAEVFGFARDIIEFASSGDQECYTGDATISGKCIKENGVGGEIIKYGKIVDTFTYGDNPYHGYECTIQYFSGNIRSSTLFNGVPKYKKFNQIDTIQLLFMEAGGVHIILGNNGFYYMSTVTDIQNCFRLISVSNFRKPNYIDVLALYYKNILISAGAYNMRSPAGVSEETFNSWYTNVTNINFREDTLKDLGDNTYEFLVDMTENGIKSTYKVKSKVDLTNFKINNLSSVKQ